MLDDDLASRAGDAEIVGRAHRAVVQQHVEGCRDAAAEAEQRLRPGLALHPRHMASDHADRFVDFAEHHPQRANPVRPAVDDDAAASPRQLVSPRLGRFGIVAQRIVEAGAGVEHLAHRALVDQLLRLHHVRPVLRLFRHHEHHVGLGRERENALGAFQGVRHRLFQHDVLASGEGFRSRLLVQIVRQHQVHRIELALFQGIRQRRERRRAGALGHRLGVRRV